MSKEELDVVNGKLIAHLQEKKIKDAFYYAPGKPEWYWTTNNKKIAICNVETYNKNKDEDYKGINLMSGERLDEISYGNKTIANSVFLNFCIRSVLQGKIKFESEQSIKDFRKITKTDKCPEFYNMYEALDLSLYFNFRYSVSDKRQANYPYVMSQYLNDEFYRQHYRDYVKAAEIDILILGDKHAINLINLIYPEMNGKLSYCGEPVLYNGILFVSIPHPSRINYSAMLDCVNKIEHAMKNNG